MYKAGGIIAIIAGIFGIFAAGFTLLFGGVAAAFEVSRGTDVVALGWGGVVFSFLVIVFGAIALSKARWAGIALIVSSIFGIVLGGGLVAVFMCLSLVGGFLVAFDSKAKQSTNAILPATDTSYLAASTTPYEQKSKSKGLLISGVALLVVSLIGCIAYIVSTKSKPVQAEVAAQTIQNSSNSVVTKKVELAPVENATMIQTTPNSANDIATNEILNAKPEITSHRTIIDCILHAANPGSSTLAERNECERLIMKEPIVDLILGVNNVSQKGDKYIIKAKGHINANQIAIVTPRNDEDKKFLENLQQGDSVRLKGKLVLDKISKGFNIDPAYLLPVENATIKSGDKSITTPSQPQLSQTPTGTQPQEKPIENSISQSNLTALKSSNVAASFRVCNLDPNGDNFLALKDAPNGSSTTLLKMTDGTSLTVLESSNSWHKVQMTNGKTGWAHSKWICQANGLPSLSAPVPNSSSSNSMFKTGEFCFKDEQTVFSCRTKKNIVSLCDSNNSTSKGLNYRFGQIDGQPDLTYPDSNSSTASRTFKIQLPSNGDLTQSINVAFDNGINRYTVFDTRTANGQQKQGVSVEDKGVKVADIRCAEKPSTEFNIEVLKKLSSR